MAENSKSGFGVGFSICGLHRFQDFGCDVIDCVSLTELGWGDSLSNTFDGVWSCLSNTDRQTEMDGRPCISKLCEANIIRAYSGL